MPSFRVRHSNTPLCRPGLRYFSGTPRSDSIGLRPGKLLLFQPILLETRERGQAPIQRVSLTAALFVVQVSSAVRAQAAAFALADDLYGQLQKHLFLKHVRQKEAIPQEKPNLGIVVAQTV